MRESIDGYERDPAMTHDHQPTQDLGWFLFGIMPSGVDECIADQMLAEGVYGRPTHFGGPTDA